MGETYSANVSISAETAFGGTERDVRTFSNATSEAVERGAKRFDAASESYAASEKRIVESSDATRDALGGALEESLVDTETVDAIARARAETEKLAASATTLESSFAGSGAVESLSAVGDAATAAEKAVDSLVDARAKVENASQRAGSAATESLVDAAAVDAIARARAETEKLAASASTLESSFAGSGAVESLSAVGDAATAAEKAVDSLGDGWVKVENASQRAGSAATGSADALPKWAKGLGVVVDANGRLINSEFRVVSGLTRAQVAAGMWVDELGNVRAANGGFLDGLSKVQIALGMYKDEAGNTRNALDEIVVAANDASDALGGVGAGAPVDLSETFDGAIQAAQGAASWFSQVGTVLNAVGGNASTTSRVFASLAAGIENFAQGFDAGKQALKFLNDFREATKSATAAQVALNFASSNWASILGGVALAGTAVWTAWKASAAESTGATEELTEAFRALEERARAAGMAMKGASDVENLSAFEARESEKNVGELRREVESLKSRLEAERERAANERASSGASTGTFSLGDAIAEANLESELKAKTAEYEAAYKTLLDAARENAKTEIEKLEASKAEYDALAKTVANEEERAVAAAESARLGKEIDEARRRERDEANKAAEDARNAALSDLGFADLKRAAEEAARSLEGPATAQAEYAATLDKYKSALAAGTITQEQFDEAQKAAKAVLDARNKKEAEESDAENAKSREETRAALGIDALMESLKTPKEVFDEALAKIDAALKAGAIDADEANALKKNATAERERAESGAESDGVGSLENAAGKLAASSDKLGAASGKLAAAEAGSSTVYSMQIASRNAYQTRALEYAARRNAIAERQLYYAERTVDALTARAALPVWG